MIDVAEEHVADEITPEVLSVAVTCLSQTLSTRTTEQAAATAWLTVEEYRLALGFVELYKQQVPEDLNAGNVGARVEAINTLIGTDFAPGNPLLERLMTDLQLDIDDLAYALWALKDLQQTL